MLVVQSGRASTMKLDSPSFPLVGERMGVRDISWAVAITLERRPEPAIFLS